MSSQKITIKDLELLLAKGKVKFTYTKKDGTEKTTTGTLKKSVCQPGGIDSTGTLHFWDFVKDDWSSVHKNSIINVISSSDINSSDPISKVNFVPSTKNYLIDNVSKQDLELLLKTKIIKFEYLKKDGQKRIAFGTNDQMRTTKSIPLNDGTDTKLFHYFDIEKDSIRSISIHENDTFKVLEVLDLPLKK